MYKKPPYGWLLTFNTNYYNSTILVLTLLFNIQMRTLLPIITPNYW